MSPIELLRDAEEFLVESVSPKAAEIDVDPVALREALTGLCHLNLMALRRPLKYGGPELGEPEFRQFQESVARYSGALAFLQTQHQSAVSLIARSENGALKEEYLPRMADGQALVGIGFSQLRRPGEPIMKATPVDGGYILNGHVPWITGWSIFPEFLIGASLDDGRSVFALMPFSTHEGIVFGPPMRLAAMESAQTVSADVSAFPISEARVVSIKPPNWIHRNDMINITLQGFFALGCARAGLDLVESSYRKRKFEFLGEALASLDAELGACRDAMISAQSVSGEETTIEKLNLRGWAIDLAARCAHAAVAATGGSANAADNPAQRIYREALVYTVSAQTTPIMEATLRRLMARRA